MIFNSTAYHIINKYSLTYVYAFASLIKFKHNLLFSRFYLRVFIVIVALINQNSFPVSENFVAALHSFHPSSDQKRESRELF